MCPAAGAAVEPIYADDPQGSGALRGFAQCKRGRGIFERDLDRPGLGDDFRATVLCPFELFGSERRRVHIDGRNFGAQVKAHRADREQFFEHRGQQVLPGVLLHVVVAAFPVDETLYLCGAERRLQKMPDAVFLVDHFLDGDASQRAQVEGLPAGGGIERGAVEVHAKAVGRGFHHAGVELAEIAILIVETFGHLVPSTTEQET